MPPIVPAARKETDPAEWSGLELLAATVLLEAESESDEGKLACAWTVRNRMDATRATVHEVVLARLQYSCWNPDYAGMRKVRLTTPSPVLWERCWRAAAAAYWRLLVDPTGGARHYYNPDLASPAWAASATSSIRIGRHLFLIGVA